MSEQDSTTIIKSLQRVLKEYDRIYQARTVDIGEQRETPHTLFHEIIEQQISSLKPTTITEEEV